MLYQKYRPKNIEEMVGSHAEFNACKKLIEGGTHAFMLVGSSGCGKTTLARIAATDILKAEQVVEINSSDARGIDTVREMIEMIKFRPLGDAKMVYILDEVHKTTNEFQNALLKPLEDCPPWAYFFLGTTNPEKLIKAIHTRCSRVSLNPLSNQDIHKLVSRTAIAEKAPAWFNEVIPIIVDNSEGSARQALVLMEKMLTCQTLEDAKKVTYNIEMEDDNTINLCRAVMNGNWPGCREALRSLQGKDPENIRRAILGYASKVVLSGNDSALRVLYTMKQDVFASGFPGLVSLVAECTTRRS